MQRNSRFLLLLPAVALFGCTPAQPPAASVAPAQDAASVRAYIEQADVRFEEALGRGDAAALAAMYTPDAVVLAPNAPPLQGQQAIQGLWTAAIQQMGFKKLDLDVTDVEVSGDQAVELGNYALTIQPQGQAEVVDRGKYMVVWKKQPDGTWKLHRDMFNTSMPAQAPAARSEVGRAARGDTVWVILNHIRPEKRAQFERFLHEIFWPGGQRVGQADPVVARTFAQTRILHPTGANKDGTYTYAFLMDPVLGNADYTILNLLKKAYPAAEAERYYREMFLEARAGGSSHRFVQSPN